LEKLLEGGKERGRGERGFNTPGRSINVKSVTLEEYKFKITTSSLTPFPP
jgi:hypothetical protein